MLISFIFVLLIGISAWIGTNLGFQSILGFTIPLCAITIFIFGTIWRILYWAKSPEPFPIPTTAGQEASLPWIKTNPLETPMTYTNVWKRMLLEILAFRSLFRNTDTNIFPIGPQVRYLSSKWLWFFALLFHYSFLIIFLRHFRFFIEPIPEWLMWLESFDGIMQIGVPRFFMTDMFVTISLLYLFLRRIVHPNVRYISLTNDYFPLFLLIGIVLTGMYMRYFDRIDVAQAKVYAMGIVTFRPQTSIGLNTIFFIHLTLLSVLLMYFPFSKLTHMIGIFLSPTRNMRCNTREVRHINPWNKPAPYRTYVEYEQEFHDVMIAAGIPLEKPIKPTQVPTE